MIRVGKNLYLKPDHISGFSEPVEDDLGTYDRLKFEVYLVGGQTLVVEGDARFIDEVTTKLTAALDFS